MERAAYRMELKRRRAKEVKCRMALFLLLCVFILVGICTSFITKANNVDDVLNMKSPAIEDDYTPEIRYTNHQVEKGGSLWDIASELSDVLELSIWETIEFVKTINGLISDDLYEGQSIIVPYLIDETQLA